MTYDEFLILVENMRALGWKGDVNQVGDLEWYEAMMWQETKKDLFAYKHKAHVDSNGMVSIATYLDSKSLGYMVQQDGLYVNEEPFVSLIRYLNTGYLPSVVGVVTDGGDLKPSTKGIEDYDPVCARPNCGHVMSEHDGGGCQRISPYCTCSKFVSASDIRPAPPIDVKELRHILTSLGWKCKTRVESSYERWVKHDYGILLPLDKDDADYRELMSNAMYNLCVSSLGGNSELQRRFIRAYVNGAL